MARRGLTEEDRAAWARYASLVTPLPGRAPIAATPEPSPSVVRTSPPAARPAPPRPSGAAPVVIGTPPAGLDRASWERLRAGKLAPQRRLDLHGRTAQAAYHGLYGFLRRAHDDRLRVVEIVTGLGRAEGSGVIRREFPLWLNLPAIRPLVLAACHPHAANPGSVLLLLRRPR